MSHSPAHANVTARFTGDWIEPTSPTYDEARRLWNAMLDKRPAIVARCRSTADVVAALAHARQEGLEVAVRCGGHSVAGLSSTHGGLLIDLQPMNRVTVDPEARRARVPGGSLLGDFDRATDPHGLATTGGTVHHTGVAGLTLGGGVGWLARKHGLACDNMVSAEVVTANGEIVRASLDEHAELFWGLRGGGGNFGIVTEFEFQLHPVGAMLSVQLRYAATHARAVLDVFREMMAAAPPELCGMIGIGPGRGTGNLEGEEHANRELYLWCVYSGANLDKGERLIDPLRRAATTRSAQIERMRYVDLQSATGSASGHGRRHYWKGSLMWELSDAFLDAFVDRGQASRLGCGIELFSIGGAIARVGEDETAYSNRGATFDMLPAATWDDPADDEYHLARTRENWEALSAFSRGEVYVNDLGTDVDERVRDVYGSRKFDRLTALKTRWDPQNVFRLNANIPPATAPTR